MKPRILLVDDDPAIRSTLGRVLHRDYEVTFAKDGAEALAHVEAGEPFDVVLTDIEMPVVNGRELFEQLVGVEPMLAARIVVMTAGPKTPDLRAWADAFPPERVVRKPVGLDVFLATIQRVLDGRD